MENGILIRSDLHRLFDTGYVKVTASYRFRVGERLRAGFRNGHSYHGLDGVTMGLPKDSWFLAHREHLAWHQESVFLG